MMQRLKILMGRFFVLITVLIVAACWQDNQRIATLISDLQPTTANGISATLALKLAPQTYMCILEPYVSQLDIESKSEEEINAFLKKNDFRGTEHEWTVIYGSSNKWTIESIRSKIISSEYLKNQNGKRINSKCSHADQVVLIKHVQGTVSFNFKEKK